jgi:hypothetical protein
VYGTDYYPGSPAYYLEMVTPEVLEKLEHWLNEAFAKADAAKVEARLNRVRHMLVYIRKTMAALHSLQALQAQGICRVDKGWPCALTDPGTPASSTFKAEWDATSEAVAGMVGVALNMVSFTFFAFLSLTMWKILPSARMGDEVPMVPADFCQSIFPPRSKQR